MLTLNDYFTLMTKLFVFAKQYTILSYILIFMRDNIKYDLFDFEYQIKEARSS